MDLRPKNEPEGVFVGHDEPEDFLEYHVPEDLFEHDEPESFLEYDEPEDVFEHAARCKRRRDAWDRALNPPTKRQNEYISALSTSSTKACVQCGECFDPKDTSDTTSTDDNKYSQTHFSVVQTDEDSLIENPWVDETGLDDCQCPDEEGKLCSSCRNTDTSKHFMFLSSYKICTICFRPRKKRGHSSKTSISDSDKKAHCSYDQPIRPRYNSFSTFADFTRNRVQDHRDEYKITRIEYYRDPSPLVHDSHSNTSNNIHPRSFDHQHKLVEREIYRKQYQEQHRNPCERTQHRRVQAV